MSEPRYAAILLAGDRGPTDPVACATGAPCKALSPVAGTPLVWRVIEILKQIDALGPMLLAGPARSIMTANPEFATALAAAGVRWIEPGPTPSTSATAALAQLDDDQPAIITTADHALLAPAMIEALLADRAGHDLSVGLVSSARVRAAYPNSRRTAIRLAPPPGYCSCNLFAIH